MVGGQAGAPASSLRVPISFAVSVWGIDTGPAVMGGVIQVWRGP
jgi:hypothetical protein